MGRIISFCLLYAMMRTTSTMSCTVMKSDSPHVLEWGEGGWR